MNNPSSFKSEYKKLLKPLIAIPSISAQPQHFSDCIRAANYLSDRLRVMGFTVQLISTYSKAPPTIIAQRITQPETAPIGIYGHYDVQPPDPTDAWHSEPFLLAEREGRYFGRGVADNKGHIAAVLIALQHLIDRNKALNITIIFEGEEEVGSVHFEENLRHVKQNSSLLQRPLEDCAAWYVVDTGMFDQRTPQIYTALRGLVYFLLTIKTGERDLHSGIYGNRVYNPLHLLSEFFTRLKDPKTGKVRLPGFSRQIRDFSTEELQQAHRMVRSEAQEKDEAGVYALRTFDNLHPSLISKYRPSLELHGITGGYMGEGAKTVIPAEATARFSLRLVEYQTAEEAIRLVTQAAHRYFKNKAKFTLKVLSQSDPFYTSQENKYTRSTARILQKTFGSPVRFGRSGGSIPASEILQRLYGKPVILTGFTLPDDHIHAPDENIHIATMLQGITVLEQIFTSLN